MSRWTYFIWVLLALAFGISACSERIVETDMHFIMPDSMQATIGDTIAMIGIYTGDPAKLARLRLDKNSDGIFDSEETYVGDVILVPDMFSPFIGSFGNDVIALVDYERPGEYIATMQATTVDNRLIYTTTKLRITDGIPVLVVEVPENAGCGETFTVTGHAVDDAGLNAFWDLNGNGIPDESLDFDTEVELSAELSFDEPGNYPLTFGAADNDGHIERRNFIVVVGVEPEWESPSSLAEERADHAGVPYADEIYIFGGRQGHTTLGSVEIYDPVTDALRPGAPMPTPRWGLKAEVLNDLIYVVGGVTAGGQEFAGVEIYDPVGDSWSVFPADAPHSMRIPKRGFSMLRVGEQFAGGDSLLIFGGWTGAAASDTSAIYNAVVDTFSLDKTRFMRSTRVEMGAVVAWEEGSDVRGRLYAIGGSSDGATPSSTMEAYNPATGFWSIESSMPTPRFGPSAAFLDGKIYVFGGAPGLAGASNTVEVFSIATEQWDAAPEMPEARKGALAVPMNGRIYLIGGATPASSPFNTEGSADIQIFLPWRCAP